MRRRKQRPDDIDTVVEVPLTGAEIQEMAWVRLRREQCNHQLHDAVCVVDETPAK